MKMKKFFVLLLGAGLVAVVAAWWLRAPTPPGLPDPNAPEYGKLVREFYRGLAHLDIGLLAEAEGAFTSTTEAAPAEPSTWSNLGLVRLRLGAYEAAAEPIARAVALAPDNARVVYLEARLALLRGQIDEGITRLRRAVELDPGNLRARFALFEELERSGLPQSDAERQALLADLRVRDPENLVLLLESVRLAALLNDVEGLRAGIARLDQYANRWPPAAGEPHAELRQAAIAGDLASAGRAVTFLRNVLAPTPVFQDGLDAIDPGFALVADPFDEFLVVPAPAANPSPADLTLTFAGAPPIGDAVDALDGVVVSLDGTAPPAVFVTDGTTVSRIESSATSAIAQGVPGTAARLATFDWNNDFRMDLMTTGEAGMRLLTQSDAGAFGETEIRVSAGAPLVTTGITGAWAADIEMDGDLDIVLGRTGGDPQVLRNNGDGTWQTLSPFDGAVGLRSFAWADLDRDGDPDAALLSGDGVVHVFLNRQAGVFGRVDVTAPGNVLNLTVGDIDADGVLDLLTIDRAGVVRRTSVTSEGWETVDLVRLADAAAAQARLFTADLDNNGALDLLVSTGAGASVWLGTDAGGFEPLPAVAGLNVFGIADLDDNGSLDLAALSDGGPVRAAGRNERAYHWQVVRPRAQPVAGDQRINSFGLGGEVQVRSGRLTQKQVLSGGPVHFGLGDRTAVDVVRIVWPNGVVQAEFDREADEAIVAEQRLKGSCPWVFAYDGQGMTFVTDFLWRSPLGLRINALDTAGVSQTEDWIRIRGEQLVPRGGFYDVRVTAELWETHYIDHVSLTVVDHPLDVEVFVDERFSPRAVTLSLQALKNLRPIGRPQDEQGRDVGRWIAALDGLHLATFERGRYQGIATDHAVAFDMPGASSERPILVAQGWVYPTDSSINVAVGQGNHAGPRGLSLEAQDDSGRWVVVVPDLGFPAGKSKTMLIDLGTVADAGLRGARRVRLRTNLEVYWDRLVLADPAPNVELRTTSVAASTAGLRFRGFSETTYERDLPETPHYDRIANVTQRWRDLTGLYTRFGDVWPLVERVDDRYVIMNAGDELQLQFAVPANPPDGWTRDFVLVGDGWNKDGDFNTGHSATVLPLPSHDNPEYEGADSAFALLDDPVFRRHPSDWELFHTRVITPRDFVRGWRRTQ